MGFENGKLVRVALRADRTDGKLAVTVLHYDLDDGSGLDVPNDPQSLADAFADDVMTHYAGLFDNSWTIQAPVVEQEKDPLNPTSARSAWTSGSTMTGTGDHSGDKLPDAICLIVSLKTAHVGRRFRGRIFVPGTYGEGDQDSGVFNTAAFGRVDPFIAAIPREPDLAEGASGATAKWCVYSKTQRAANLDPYASAVSSVVRKPQVHWLRSRER